MRAIGRISYSWYLWHWPVLVLAPIAIGQPLGLAARLAAALVSAVLAVLTLRLIENPLRFAAPIRRSARASLALGAAVTAAAVAVGQVLLGSVTIPVSHGPAAMPITITAAPAIRTYSATVYATPRGSMKPLPGLGFPMHCTLHARRTDGRPFSGHISSLS